MSAQDFSNWIPIEYDASVVQRPQFLSAVERFGTGVPMSRETKIVFRDAGNSAVGVGAKSIAFPEDAGVNDKVTLVAAKFPLAFRMANEDLEDSLVDVIKVKQAAYARSYSYTFDNACLATTAASNGSTVPFTSVYKAVRSADSDLSYNADDNYLASATSGGVTYDDLNNLFSLVEGSNWYDPANQVVIAHPHFKKTLRGIKDSQNRPIFVPGVYGQGGTSTPDTLFDLPIHWTLGAKTSATATGTPTGNPLMISINPQYMLRGDRVQIEAKVDNVSQSLTDETLLLLRTRKAFNLSVPNAAAVLEALS